MVPTAMKIGELAKQTGLSIRTLHYYDQIGLLSPTHRTESSYRLYIDRDIIRLQQIISLRQLGFSLEEIRECLDNRTFSLLQTIEMHKERLQEQIVLSSKILDRLNIIAKELQNTNLTSISQLLQIIEAITMSNLQSPIPFERFTPAAIHALELAQSEAHHLKHDYFGTEQILVGLLAEGNSIAAKLLMSVGVNVEELRSLVKSSVGYGNGSHTEVPITARAKITLELAVFKAQQSTDFCVSTEHILLGILKEANIKIHPNKGLAIKLLEDLSVDLKYVEQQLISTMSQ
jgi:DNA-binding transcriptional MerR regulator